MNAKPILFPQGISNPGGTTEVLYQFAENFATFPSVPDFATATDFEVLAKLATLPTLKTGEKLEKLYCTVEEGEIKSTMVGERDGKGFENEASIFFPGNTPEFYGFLAATANRQIIFFIKEKNGVWRVLGSLEDPAYVDTSESTSGKKIADRRGTTVAFKASGPTAAPILGVAITPLLTAAV